MKIIYKQSQSYTPFNDIGIENCYFKALNDKDIKNATKKKHHHTGFELHVMNYGYQTYQTGNKLYKIEAGNFIIIPPGVKHCFTDAAEGSSKISVTFHINESAFRSNDECMIAKIPKHITENIERIMEEYKKPQSFSKRIIESRVFEIVALFLRKYGIYEDFHEATKENEDLRLSMAKKYIRDNIEFNLTVSDVAHYCYLSTKQLTRLFEKHDNITPAKYIRDKKIELIETLMSTDLTIEEISRKLQFSNLYNFHLFFKKYIGMPPGKYKKMLK